MTGERIWKITLVWSPSRRTVFGKRTWTYVKTFYTYDREKALQMNRELRAGRYGPKVRFDTTQRTLGDPLDTWLKSRSRNGKVQRGWR